MKFLADLRAKQALYSQYGPPCSYWRAFLSDGTLANGLYRLQLSFTRMHLAPLALAAHLLNKWINGCVIGVHASFDGGFVLIHPVGVIINSAVHGGKNVWLESSVVIGDNRGKSPTLGDNIFVGSGAKIIGNVSIGSGARVGANAVVLHDVAPNQTVGGIPAKPLIMRDSV